VVAASLKNNHKLGEFAPTRTFKGHVKEDRKAKRR